MPARLMPAAPDGSRPPDFQSLRASAMQTIFRAFERATEGTLIVDRDCRIVWISERHARRFGHDDPAALLGMPVEDVIPNSRMREVVQTGQPLLLDTIEAPGKPLVAVRLPLKEGSEVLGAVGFVLIDEWTTSSPLLSRVLQMQAQMALKQTGQNPPPDAAPSASTTLPHAEAMHEFERRLIADAIAESSSVAAAARRLGIGRATLYRKMAQLGLPRERGNAQAARSHHE